jgi:polysaccharide deacetylase family sporulation protein PdaB
VLTIAVPRRLAVGLGRALGVAAAAAAAYALARYAAPPAMGAPGPARLAALEVPVRDVATSQREIALTFDISWGTVMPPKVVGILRRERVPATFFLSGPWVAAHPELVREIAAVPYFEIESHGQAHVNFSGLGPAGVAANVERANAAIAAVTGRRPTMIRPPNGDYSRASLRATAALGMRTIIWGTDSLDWMNPGVSTIVRRVVRGAHPGDIVLLHASDTCRQTDLALPEILARLRAGGYRFVTLSQLLRAGTPQAHSLS